MLTGNLYAMFMTLRMVAGRENEELTAWVLLMLTRYAVWPPCISFPDQHFEHVCISRKPLSSSLLTGVARVAQSAIEGYRIEATGRPSNIEQEVWPGNEFTSVLHQGLNITRMKEIPGFTKLSRLIQTFEGDSLPQSRPPVQVKARRNLRLSGLIMKRRLLPSWDSYFPPEIPL